MRRFDYCFFVKVWLWSLVEKTHSLRLAPSNVKGTCHLYTLQGKSCVKDTCHLHSTRQIIIMSKARVIYTLSTRQMSISGPNFLIWKPKEMRSAPAPPAAARMHRSYTKFISIQIVVPQHPHTLTFLCCLFIAWIGCTVEIYTIHKPGHMYT